MQCVEQFPQSGLMGGAAILKNSWLNAMSLWGRQLWVWIVILLSSCVNLGKLLNLSELISLPVKMGMKILYHRDVWVRKKLS